MTTRRRKLGTHCPVSAKKPGKDISKEPEMQELKEVVRSMPPAERQRTLGYLGAEEEGAGACGAGKAGSPEDAQKAFNEGPK